MDLKFKLIKELSFYLNFAILATVFSVFALVSGASEKIILFGVLTIMYSFTGQVVDVLFHAVFGESLKWLLVIFEVILLISWILLVLNKVI